MGRLATVMLISIMLAGAFAPCTQAEHLLGGGVEYLKTLGDIKDEPEFDSNAFGIIGSYQYNGGLLKFEADVEWIPDFGGTSKSLIQPQAYALIGNLIYGGAGIGIGYFDGEWESNPFYALRAGVNLPIGGLILDVFGVYRFQEAEVIEHLGESDLDAITFCALIRFGLGR